MARAAYGQPCIPYQYTAAGRVGFWSGFFPVELVLTDVRFCISLFRSQLTQYFLQPPEFQVAVNDTEPIFFYCSAPGACFQGMVGVVNPVSSQRQMLSPLLSRDGRILRIVSITNSCSHKMLPRLSVLTRILSQKKKLRLEQRLQPARQ